MRCHNGNQKIEFRKKEVQIKEACIDETGKTRERIKKVMMSAGNAASTRMLILLRLKKTTNNPLSIRWFLKMNGAEV